MHFIFDHIFLTMIGFVVISGIIGKILKPHPRISNALAMLFAIALLGALALGFGGMGIAMAIQEMHKNDWKMVCFSIPFILIGGAIMSALLWGGPSMLKTNRIKAAHPLEPWLWHSDWATGQIPDHSVGGAIGSWIIAMIVAGMSIPATIGATQKYLHTHENMLLIVWLFPVVSLWLMLNALRATGQAAVFGKSIFSIDTLPASPGGTLAGTIRVAKTLRPKGPVRLHLTCTRTTNTGGDDGSTPVIDWETEQQLDQLPSTESPVEIPVYFSLPPDVPATTTGSPRSQIAWQLEVTAPTAELTYGSKFKIPVFQLSNPVVLPPPVAFVKSRAHEAPPTPADLRGITVSRLANGGCELNFAAGRNAGMGIFMSLSGAILTIAGVLAIRSNAPLGAEIIVWLLALVFDVVAVNTVLTYSKVTARSHGLEVEHGMLMWARRRSIPSDSISNIEMRIGGQGQTGNTAYYQINAIVGSKTIPLAGGIRGKTNAQNIITEIKQALGIAADVTHDVETASQS